MQRQQPGPAARHFYHAFYRWTVLTAPTNFRGQHALHAAADVRYKSSTAEDKRQARSERRIAKTHKDDRRAKRDQPKEHGTDHKRKGEEEDRVTSIPSGEEPVRMSRPWAKDYESASARRSSRQPGPVQDEATEPSSFLVRKFLASGDAPFEQSSGEQEAEHPGSGVRGDTSESKSATAFTIKKFAAKHGHFANPTQVEDIHGVTRMELLPRNSDLHGRMQLGERYLRYMSPSKIQITCLIRNAHIDRLGGSWRRSTTDTFEEVGFLQDRYNVRMTLRPLYNEYAPEIKKAGLRAAVRMADIVAEDLGGMNMVLSLIKQAESEAPDGTERDASEELQSGVQGDDAANVFPSRAAPKWMRVESALVKPFGMIRSGDYAIRHRSNNEIVLEFSLNAQGLDLVRQEYGYNLGLLAQQFRILVDVQEGGHTSRPGESEYGQEGPGYDLSRTPQAFSVLISGAHSAAMQAVDALRNKAGIKSAVPPEEHTASLANDAAPAASSPSPANEMDEDTSRKVAEEPSAPGQNFLGSNGTHGVYVALAPGVNNTVRKNVMFHLSIRLRSGAEGGAMFSVSRNVFVQGSPAIVEEARKTLQRWTAAVDNKCRIELKPIEFAANGVTPVYSADKDGGKHDEVEIELAGLKHGHEQSESLSRDIASAVDYFTALAGCIPRPDWNSGSSIISKYLFCGPERAVGLAVSLFLEWIEAVRQRQSPPIQVVPEILRDGVGVDKSTLRDTPSREEGDRSMPDSASRNEESTAQMAPTARSEYVKNTEPQRLHSTDQSSPNTSAISEALAIQNLDPVVDDGYIYKRQYAIVQEDMRIHKAQCRKILGPYPERSGLLSLAMETQCSSSMLAAENVFEVTGSRASIHKFDNALRARVRAIAANDSQDGERSLFEQMPDFQFQEIRTFVRQPTEDEKQSGRVLASLKSAAAISDRVRTALQTMSHPVVVVTARVVEKLGEVQHAARALTVSSFSTVSLYPQPVISFNIKVPSRTWDAIKRANDFRVHLFVGNAEGAAMAHVFTQRYERPHEGFLRLEKLGALVSHFEDSIPPQIFKERVVLAQIRAHLMPEKCVEVGDHVIVVARVVECFYDKKCEEPHGKASGLRYGGQAYRAGGHEVKLPSIPEAAENTGPTTNREVPPVIEDVAEHSADAEPRTPQDPFVKAEKSRERKLARREFKKSAVKARRERVRSSASDPQLEKAEEARDTSNASTRREENKPSENDQGAGDGLTPVPTKHEQPRKRGNVQKSEEPSYADLMSDPVFGALHATREAERRGRPGNASMSFGEIAQEIDWDGDATKKRKNGRKASATSSSTKPSKGSSADTSEPLWSEEALAREDSQRLAEKDMPRRSSVAGSSPPVQDAETSSAADSSAGVALSSAQSSESPAFSSTRSSTDTSEPLWNEEALAWEDSQRLAEKDMPEAYSGTGPSSSEPGAPAPPSNGSRAGKSSSIPAVGRRPFSTYSRAHLPNFSSTRFFSTTVRATKDEQNPDSAASSAEIVVPSAMKMNVADYLGVPDDNKLWKPYHRVRGLFNLSSQARKAENRYTKYHDELDEELRLELEHKFSHNDRVIAKKLARNAAYDLRIMLDKGRVDFRRAAYLESAIEKGQAVLLEEAKIARDLVQEGRMSREKWERAKEILSQNDALLRTEVMRLRQVVDEEGENFATGTGEDGGGKEEGGEGFDGFKGNR